MLLRVPPTIEDGLDHVHSTPADPHSAYKNVLHRIIQPSQMREFPDPRSAFSGSYVKSAAVITNSPVVANSRFVATRHGSAMTLPLPPF